MEFVFKSIISNCAASVNDGGGGGGDGDGSGGGGHDDDEAIKAYKHIIYHVGGGASYCFYNT